MKLRRAALRCRFLGLATALLCCLGATALGAFPNEPEGFGGLSWGEPVSAAPGMIPEAAAVTGAGRQVYRRAGETLRFDGATLQSVEYVFLDGRLVRVEVRVRDLHNFLVLRDALFRRHGRGRELSERAERYVWEGAVTRMTLLSNFDIS